MNQIPTATILVSFTHQDEQAQAAFADLAERLAERLAQPVVACSLDQPERTALHAITGLLQQGMVKIVILPLFLSPAEYRDNTLADAVAFAGGRWPHAHFHLSPTPSWAEWVQVIGNVVSEASGGQSGDGNLPSLILAGRGTTDPDVNSDLVKVARLLYEEIDLGPVDVAFVTETTPSVGELIARHQTIGVKQIVVVPSLLFEGEIYRQLLSQVESARANSQLSIDNRQLTIAPPLSTQDTLIDVLTSRHAAALEDRSLLPVSWQDLQRQIYAEVEAEHKQRPSQTAADEASFQSMMAKMNEVLPPQVQGRVDIETSDSVGTTDLIFEEDGAIGWDQMFGLTGSENPFAELALAGGASHRDALLEAVSPEECLADPVRYAAVLAEIERGIHTVTGLTIVDSSTPGWIGVVCDSEEMVIWLVRAIIVENVMVRREENVLYLPASPRYVLENEILSVVTVVAKTWRFWIEHITAQQWQKVE